MVGTGTEALHHAAAHYAPAQGTHHFPEFDAIRIGLAAALLVAREQFLARAETADRLVDLAETPGIDAYPAEVLHGIAEMRELPVQHRTHAVSADDEVPVAEIAMHQRHLLRRAGIVTAKPSQRELEHRLRPIEAAVFASDLGNLPGRRHFAQRRQLVARQTVNAGRDLAEL